MSFLYLLSLSKQSSRSVSRSKLSTAMSKEVPLVLGTVVETLTGSGTDSQEVEAAFKCLEAYIEWGLTSE